MKQIFKRNNELFGIYEDDVYRVEIKKHPYGRDDLAWMDVVRKDGSTFVPWLDLQGIKNEIFGTSHEGAMLFPSEKRLVDEANHYHVFVFRDKNKKFDFGFNYRRTKK